MGEMIVGSEIIEGFYGATPQIAMQGPFKLHPPPPPKESIKFLLFLTQLIFAYSLWKRLSWSWSEDAC